jgi:uncharacterized protein (TIGR03435 family)
MLLAHPAAQALGRALLNFLWQGSFLALLLWIVKMAAPASAARARYVAACLTMLAMPAVLVITAARPVTKEPGRAAATARSAAQRESGAITDALVFYAPTAAAPHAGISGWAVCIWMAGVLLLSARAAGGWARAWKLKRGAGAASPEIAQLMRRLMLRLRISRPVRLCTSAAVQVPAVVGCLRPYILLPLTALTGLSAAQMEAILAHELAHIRRHDYLVNLLQTAIETLLFYHPAVWWVGKQMRIERENCCDDIAVAACGNAFEYASALAEMEEIRGRIPEPALAATGGDLLMRVRRLLGQPDRASRSLGAVAATVLALVVGGAVAAISLHAAPQEPEPAFEVASIKRDVSGQPGPQYRIFPGFTVQRATLKDLVTMAYGIHDFQLSGGPGWINSDRYNIEAKAEGAQVFSQEYRLLQLRRLQTLLQDRFKLAVHRETRELPVYELVVAKGGAKLQPPTCIPRTSVDVTVAPGKSMRDYCGWGGWGIGRYEFTDGKMSDLAGGLSGMLERIAVDKTGIMGRFHLQLTYAPDDSVKRFPDIPAPEPPADAPNIFTALQEQLGLKLESAKGPVEVLVIDHVEKPSEN